MEGKPGWIVMVERIFADPNSHVGRDYQEWSPYNIISRLQHDWNPGGCIPLPEKYGDFAIRCGNFAQASQGCTRWLIGNEMNYSIEWPQGQPITPSLYAQCYQMCRQEIKARPGHENDEVIVGAVAPWNIETAYPGNESGDWCTYLTDVLAAVGDPDAISLHAYTHGPDPILISSEQTMDPPFQHRRYHFRVYRDFLVAVPQWLRTVPIYITEANQDGVWENVNRGWVQEAYREIDAWNRMDDTQKVHALCLYRWKGDKYEWYNKDGVKADFQAAVRMDYQVTPPVPPDPEPPPECITEDRVREIFWEEMEKAQIVPGMER